MARVSQNPLGAETKKEITDSLVRIMTKIDDDTLFRQFINDLVTPVEKLMLAKRLMVAVLLQRGYSYRPICEALKISKTTVLIIQRDLQRGGEGYRAVFLKFFKQPKGHKVTGAIERFLDAITSLPIKGSPSSFGRFRRTLHR